MVGKAIALFALAASEESVSSKELPSSTLTCLLLGAATKLLLLLLLVLWPCCRRQQGNLCARAVQQRATVVRGRTSQVVRLESVYSEQKARPTLPSPVVRE